jgi:hypothetical protein
MAVPSGDERDHAFAKHFEIPITNIFGEKYTGENAYSEKIGTIENSGYLSGMSIADAAETAIDTLVKIEAGKRRVNYRLRDAGFSRQRYWGEPFPIVYVNDMPYGVDENKNTAIEELPVTLPHVDSYKPGPEGKGPLANLEDWVQSAAGERETNTMPGYAGSSWYFLRYMDPHNDTEFAATDYFQKMKWLKSENEDLYDPEYTDLIRVAFTSQFNRGRLSDLVSLLSGRNFETRTFEQSIAEQSFKTLEKGVHSFINETNFKRFLMIVKSAGFISPKLIRSKNALNFAYILYLKLKDQGVPDVLIGSYVPKWLVYSMLTGRYSGSPESVFDYDIRQIAQKSFDVYFKENENAELSDAFWQFSLPQSLDTSVASSPYFHVFLASQVKANDRGFLSKDVLVGDLISLRGDIHHLFPKDYLKKNDLGRGDYNQIANYVYMQSEINIKVGNKAPNDYFSSIMEQISSGNLHLSGINNLDDLKSNLESNCVPFEIVDMGIDSYQDFLSKRRKLMADKIKNYYFSL